MNRLLKLKKWLTIPETARYLSIVLDEEVTEADVLRLALDGHLKLSIYFVNIKTAQLGKIVTWDETEWFCAPPLNEANKTETEFFILGKVDPEKFKIYPSKLQKLWNKFSDEERKKLTFFLRDTVIDNERFLNLSDEIMHIDGGVWDLPLFGSERLDIMQKYQMITDGHDVTDVSLEGVFIEEPNSQKMCRLQNDETGYPAGGLPQDSVLVVRTAALREFEQRIAESDEKNTRSVKESTRKTENLLRALASIAIDAYNYNPNDTKSLAPQDIVDAMNQHGASFCSKTIRNWLKEGASLLEINLKKD